MLADACAVLLWMQLIRLAPAFKPGVQGEPGIEATLGRGLAMYDLKEAQIHSETETDTHCLLAWSCDTVLLAFRGTATKVNVLADLKVCTASAVTCPTSLPLDHLFSLSGKWQTNT